MADLVAEDIAAGLADFRGRLLAHVDTFNIVVFGRTTVGKSTLISALCGADGTRISNGRRNNTVEAEATRWENCLVWDVPGLDGEDGTIDYERLEEIAREKADIADIVFLCFDTTSTEDSVFAKMAAWVIALNKPVVAVLNVKHADWRFPAQREYPRWHLSACQAVADHAGYIRQELGAAGLYEVPLIALHSADAAYARAGERYAGEDRVTRERRAARAGGGEQLLAWSNFPVLEGLLIDALSVGAVPLRLGALVAEVDGKLAIGDERLREVAEKSLSEQAAVVDRGVAELLSLFGAPGPLLNDAPAGDQLAGDQLAGDLAQVEKCRGASFDPPRVGLAGQHARRLIADTLGQLRQQALDRADSVADDILTRRRTLAGEEFARQVYDEAAIRAARDRVSEDLAAYIDERVRSTRAAVEADLRAITLRRAELNGEPGKVLRWLSLGSKAAGPVLALANLWNPFGWWLGATLLLANGATAILGWRADRSAAERRDAAVADAYAAARQAVEETFDKAEQQAAAAAADLITKAMLDALGPEVRAALDLYTARDRVAERRERIGERRAEVRKLLGEQQAQLPPGAGPAEVVRRAVKRCEQRVAKATRLPAADTGPYWWLGETQRADPGMAAAIVDPAPGGAHRRPGWTRRRREDAERVRDSLRTAAAAASAVPRPGAGQAWLARARELLLDGRAPDTETAGAESAMLAALDDLATGPPRVILMGGYNTGKTSFIRRLLVEDGQRPPRSLRVGARPTTEQVTGYQWRDLLLCDVPGLHGGRTDLDERARAQVAGAAAVIFLTGQSLQDLPDLARILTGDPGRGQPGKDERTIIVLNRCDEIGRSPQDEPEAHAKACADKRREAATALGNLTAGAGHQVGPVDPSRILATASAPCGRQPGTRAEYDRYRDWDGFDQLLAAIDAIRPGLLANGRDVSVLHDGIARLLTLADDGAARLRQDEEQARELGRLRQRAADGLDAGQALREELIRRLADQLGDHLVGELNRALRSEPEDRLVIARRLDNWTAADATLRIAREWQARSGREIADWATQLDEDIERRLTSDAFLRAAGRDIPAARLGFLRAGTRTGMKTTTKALDLAGDALSLTDAEAVAGVAWRTLGVTLSEEAVGRLGTVALRAGAGLQVLGGIVGLILAVDDYRREREVDECRLTAGRHLREQAAEWARNVALGTAEAGPGVLSDLGQRCARLKRDVGRLETSIEAVTVDHKATKQRQDVYGELINAARQRLR